ncbi:MAG: type IV pilin protein [Amphritea sp.]
MNARNTKGFTLIELMIVVAIVGIIAAIAYPSYLNFVREARRSDAMAALLRAQLEQEKFRSNNTTYGTTVASVGVSATSPEGFYTIAVVSGSTSGTAFVVTAAPAGVQVGDDCATFAVDESGPDYSGAYADADCWNR